MRGRDFEDFGTDFVMPGGLVLESLYAGAHLFLCDIIKIKITFY